MTHVDDVVADEAAREAAEEPVVDQAAE